eukprot:scaffold966_cov415-Prasinococcus_capsulatus_cf.AAC.29
MSELQVQTWGEDWQTMAKNGLALASIVPPSDEGLQLVPELACLWPPSGTRQLIRASCCVGHEQVVKLPITKEGVRAASMLKREGVRITMTGLYASHQAITAASLGAEYAAPYLGRMDDNQRGGVESIAQMLSIASNTEKPLRVLVASIRSVADMATLATYGADTFTFSPQVASALLTDPLTMAAASDFEAAALSMGATTLEVADPTPSSTGRSSTSSPPLQTSSPSLNDPLEKFCEDNPSDSECKVFD